MLSTGLLGRLIEEHPGIRVTVAVGRLSAPLFAAVPGLERIVVIDKQSWHRHWLRLWRRTAFSRWDLVVDLRGSAISYLVPARRRVEIGSASCRAGVCQYVSLSVVCVSLRKKKNN